MFIDIYEQITTRYTIHLNFYVSIDLCYQILFFCQGLFQKAEALYVLGDFETALVFFHRGHKARPELQEFRLGIQKCQEAINNSIGSKYTVLSRDVDKHEKKRFKVAQMCH